MPTYLYVWKFRGEPAFWAYFVLKMTVMANFCLKCIGICDFSEKVW